MSLEKQYNAGNVATDYNKESLKNQEVDPSRSFMREQVAKFDKNSELLDVGCGSGVDLKAYKDMGFTHLYGIDPSEKLIDEAANLLNESVHLGLGSFESIPFKDGMFDEVVSRHALHYSKDIPASIREVARVLKQGGHFVVVVSHPNADALEKANAEGNITITLFNGKVPITFPQHASEEYFSEEFKQLFTVTEETEFVGKEQDRGANGVPNALCFVAVKK